MAVDLTSKIERIEAFEERLGLRLDNLSARIEDYLDTRSIVSVLGDVQAKAGTKLQEDVQLVVAVYGLSGQVIETESRSLTPLVFLVLRRSVFGSSFLRTKSRKCGFI